jgi:large subunit ribosomal protein L17
MHRHQYTGRKLGRKAAPRKALLRNLASQIILHEQVTTTLPKAKEVRPILEKLITRAKKDSFVNRRLVAKFLSNKDKSVAKLFEELGPLYADRNGGYLRIIKTANRKGDNADMAVIQLLDTDKLTRKEVESSEKRKTKSKKSIDGESAVANKRKPVKPAVKKSPAKKPVLSAKKAEKPRPKVEIPTSNSKKVTSEK